MLLAINRIFENKLHFNQFTITTLYFPNALVTHKAREIYKKNMLEDLKNIVLFADNKLLPKGEIVEFIKNEYRSELTALSKHIIALNLIRSFSLILCERSTKCIQN
jgi:hypothetical protein